MERAGKGQDGELIYTARMFPRIEREARRKVIDSPRPFFLRINPRVLRRANDRTRVGPKESDTDRVVSRASQPRRASESLCPSHHPSNCKRQTALFCLTRHLARCGPEQAKSHSRIRNERAGWMVAVPRFGIPLTPGTGGTGPPWFWFPAADCIILHHTASYCTILHGESWGGSFLLETFP